MPPALEHDLAKAIRAALTARRAQTTSDISFAEFLASKDFCKRPPTPAIKAIVDASEGTPITSIDEHVCKGIFGCNTYDLPKKKRRIVVVGAGARSGKTSRLLAPKALHAAWTVPLPDVVEGERARALLIAPKRDLAAQAFQMVKGIVKASPILSAALVDEKAESLVLRRPDGKEVEVYIGSANRGGQDARGRTLVFLGMDEASFFRSDDFEVNDRDVFEAAEPRIVPGAQIWIVSTPWIDGVGLMESFISSDHGKHEYALVAARVSTRLLNPSWDADGEIERAMLKRPDGQANVDRDIYAIPYARGTMSFFDPVAISESLLKTPPQKDTVQKGAGIDLGFKNDFSALAIAHRLRQGHFTVPVLLERKPKPNQPLRPSEVRKEFADAMRSNKIDEVWADSFSLADTQEQFGNRGIILIEAPTGQEGKASTYNAAREVIHDGRLYLGHLPQETKESLREQLLSIVRRPTSGGRYEISAPRKRLTESTDGSTSGGHADAVSALVLALWAAGARVGETFETESPVGYKPPVWQTQEQQSPNNPWARSGGTTGWR